MFQNKQLLLYFIVVLSFAEFGISQSNILAKRTYCGLQHIDDYERESDDISIDEFPWIAQLLYDDDRVVKCTGSLINARYVLTAAHCLVNPYSVAKAVRLGDLNVTTDIDCVKNRFIGQECSHPPKDFDIEEDMPHPRYSVKSSLNDIGLVRLSAIVTYTDFIRPICLPLSANETFLNGQQFSVSGWGYVGFAEEQTTIKKKISTTFVSYEICKSHYANSVKLVSPFHICAIESEAYTCQGDSGGPLMLKVKQQWVQVGILSFGKVCGAKFPSVYISTSKYIEWIKQNLKL